MTEPKLGRLNRVDARDVWKHEAHSFTPWLFRHIDLLAEALGIDIEVSATEVPVGAYAVDILGKTTPGGHMGQVLTYAAGLDAAIVVWVAPRFRDEHRQTLDWLNAHTSEGIDFFGVEMELLQIDDSLPAPHFKLVAEPNAWAKATRESVATGPTERGVRYQAFFQEVLNTFKKVRPGITSASRAGMGNWFSFGAGRAGFSFSWSLPANGQLRVEFDIDTGTVEANKAFFDILLAQRDRIESELGAGLAWERMDNRRSSRIAVYRPLGSGTAFDAPSERDWMVQTMARWTDVFRPIVQELPAQP
jgi:hypothetical protein